MGFVSASPLEPHPCPKCGADVADLKYNRLLALAIYRCPCGFQFTVQVKKD
jgi:predicted RNA-binding Zn-ribbon protein involved in translation (DUF1610 family)